MTSTVIKDFPNEVMGLVCRIKIGTTTQDVHQSHQVQNGVSLKAAAEAVTAAKLPDQCEPTDPGIEEQPQKAAQ
jgi:hypothetical protein